MLENLLFSLHLCAFLYSEREEEREAVYNLQQSPEFAPDEFPFLNRTLLINIGNSSQILKQGAQDHWYNSNKK